MANVYVYSGAGGAGTGADWTNAYTTLAAALTAKAAGDDFWVANDHAETQGSAMTLTSPGTAASPAKIHCVARAGTVPPVHADLATTGLVVTTGAFGITFVGYAFCYGITFRAGTGSSSADMGMNSSTAHGWDFDTCRFELATTNAGSKIIVGTTSTVNSKISWKNVTLKFGAVGQKIENNTGTFFWRGGSVDAAGSIPTSLFSPATRGSAMFIEGVDLSALGSGKTIITPALSNAINTFNQCKLGASVTICATPTAPGSRTIFSRCDSGDTNIVDSLYSFFGTQTVETTIVRTSGASDGTTPIAQKIVTTADAKFINPFRSKPILFWNETVGSAVTATIQGIWGGGAVPTNADIWLEVFYPSDASYTLGAFANDAKASNLATAANQTAGSGTWGGSTTKFSLDVSFTPQNKGPIALVVCAAAASSTFYLDPKPVIS